MGKNTENANSHTRRPYKLEKAQPYILEARRLGLTWRDTARCAHIAERTIHDWRERAALGQEPYASMVEEWHIAEAEGSRELLRQLRQQSVEDWRATAHLLKFRGYVVTERVEAKVEVTEGPAPADVLEALAARVKAQEDGE